MGDIWTWTGQGLGSIDFPFLSFEEAFFVTQSWRSVVLAFGLWCATAIQYDRPGLTRGYLLSSIPRRVSLTLVAQTRAAASSSHSTFVALPSPMKYAPFVSSISPMPVARQV